MQRKYLLLLSLVLILSLSGCQPVCEFVVINMSGETIAVQYRLKNWAPVAPGKQVDVQVPAKVRVGEFNEAEYHWRKLAREDYVFDKATGTIMVNVSPGEVLLIDNGSNCRGYENDFPVASIKISGAKGSIELDGHQAQAQFKIEVKKYVLRYW